MTVRVRQVGRASDPQAEMQLQELTRAVNELGGDVEGVQRTLPDVIEDIEEELDNRIPIPTEPPSVPTNLIAMPAFQMFILKWDRSVSEIVDGYIVSFSTSEDGTSWSEWEEIVLPNISVFTHTGLHSNVHYRYRVLAYNRAGRSLWSNIYVGGKPLLISFSEEVINDFDWENWLEHSEPFQNIVADVEENKGAISALTQTASEISGTVAKKEFTEPLVSGTITIGSSPGAEWTQDTTKDWGNLAESLGISDWKNLYLRFTSGENEEKFYQITGTSGSTIFFSPPTENNLTAGDGYEIVTLETVASSTFQQHANMINQRVLARDSNGNLVPVAQLQVGQVDGNGYILLDASDIFVPGTMHIFDKNPGSAASGQVTINSNGVEIRGGKLSVVNPSGTVIIDGTSNMFKIRNSGYLWAEQDSISSVTFNIPSSEVNIPAFHIIYEGFEIWGTGYGNFTGDAMWPFIIDGTVGLDRSIIGGLVALTRTSESQVKLDLKCGRDTEGIYIRYYIFKEAAF